AKQVLSNVSRELQNEELEEFWFEFNAGDSATVALNEVNMLKYFQLEKRRFENSEGVMSEGIVEEDYKESSNFLVSPGGSSSVTGSLNENVNDVIQSNQSDRTLTPEQRIEQLMGMSEVQ